MTIQHHPDISTLMSYSAGSLGEALSAVVVAHLMRCDACRGDVRRLEALGGGVVSAAAGEPMTAIAALAMTLPAGPASTASRTIPDPLGRLLSEGLASFRWRWLGPGVWHHQLPLSQGVVGDLRLLKIAPGRKMPAHGHGGCELTLVIEGSYDDENGTYATGDVEDVDASTEHRPAAHHKTGCICLIASERGAVFRGPFARLLQPFTGM